MSAIVMLLCNLQSMFGYAVWKSYSLSEITHVKSSPGNHWFSQQSSHLHRILVHESWSWSGFFQGRKQWSLIFCSFKTASREHVFNTMNYTKLWDFFKGRSRPTVAGSHDTVERINELSSQHMKGYFYSFNGVIEEIDGKFSSLERWLGD